MHVHKRKRDTRIGPVAAGLLVAGSIVLAAGVGYAAFKLVEQENRSIDVESASGVYIKNARGKTIIVGKSGIDGVSIRADKYVRARNADAAADWMQNLTYDVENDGDQISIITRYPDRGGDKKNLWSMIRGISYRAHIEYIVEVPNHFDAKVSSASGDVQIVSVGGNSKVFGSSGDVFLKDLGGHVFVEISSGDVEVKNVGGNVTVQMSSGDASIMGVGGSVSVQATSGDVDAYDVMGDASIELASGDFMLKNCRGNVKAQTVSGDGVIANVDGNIKAVAASGDLDVTIKPVGQREFVLRTSSGDVMVAFYTPTRYGFFLDANTSSGSIEGNLDIELSEVSRRMLKGKVGSGDSRLYVETARGDIRIQQARGQK